MISTFDKAGLRFQYPENWSLTDESLDDWPKSVTVQSPGGGFCSIVLYDHGTEPNTLLEQTLSQMRAEYPELESSVVVEQFDETAATGYEMFFYCFDFLVSARVFVLRAADGRVFLFLWQAEDRDFAQVEPVFRAITTSLLREQAAE